MGPIVLSSDILFNFSQKVDQKRKMVKCEVGLNFALNDSEWGLLVISSDILSHFSPSQTSLKNINLKKKLSISLKVVSHRRSVPSLQKFWLKLLEEIAFEVLYLKMAKSKLQTSVKNEKMKNLKKALH